jgi:probable DNA metabolism protein
VDGEGDLFGEVMASHSATSAAFTVPREFVDLAGQVIQHRAPDRLALLYRILWRLGAEPHLLRIASDPDIQRASDLARQVSRAAHKMKAFVRFRRVQGVEPEAFVAWFEPAHRVVESTAPFFARRFSNMTWSILTPEACAHFDRARLIFTPGTDRAQPGGDELEDYWRTYYASIFNPARLKTAAMQKEMPKRYWRNLPEAALIPELIASAEARTSDMVAHAPSQPSRRIVRAAQRIARDGAYGQDTPTSLEEVMAGIDVCRRCDLWRDATQAVAGEGPSHAWLMLVGEQPGDQEDIAGRPFVGPAGHVLDEALAQAGIPRDHAYVTNAVKHFKHELRGKRRIHQTPTAGETRACNGWLAAERRLVRPRVVVALGATAAMAVFGKAMPVAANRGVSIQLPDRSQGVVTYHPSFLLRVPDPVAKAKAHAAFIEDLSLAWKLAS